jgi:Mg-chelatase subunit ChlD
VRVRRAAALVLAGGLLVAVCARERDRDERDDGGAGASRTDRRIDEQLAPVSAPAAREGLAAAILIDVSGSMSGAVAAEDGSHDAKIDIARRAARDLVDQFARYAEEHRDEPVLLGLYEFSQRSDEPDCRPIMAMGPPDRARAESALAAVRPAGGTPIGNAMITAKRELDATGLTRRHLLVVTDGENTNGFMPDRVAAAIGRRPEAERPSIYFVAFDINENRFAKVRDAGGLVLAAANARELNDTLDGLLRGKILIEK